MKVYVLIEQVYPANETMHNNVLGVYTNPWEAETEKQKEIENNIKNFDFVRDEENTNNIFAIERIFQWFQENWDNYIEYKITENEVI